MSYLSKVVKALFGVSRKSENVEQACGNCDSRPESNPSFFMEEEIAPVPPPNQDPDDVLEEGAFGAAPTYYYAYHGSYSAASRFKGWSLARTNQAIAQAYKEMSGISGANFKPWSGSGPYHIIIQFRTVVGTWNAGGQYESPKTIVLSSGREFKLNTQPWRYRIAHNLIQHETFHFLRYKAANPADHWGHSKDKTCVMNSNATNKFFCPVEVLYMQRRFGRPSKKFVPIDKVLQWNILKPLRVKLKAEWAAAVKLVDKRLIWLEARRAAAIKRDAAIVNRNAAEPGPDKIRWRDEARLWHAKILELNPKIKAHTILINAAFAKAQATVKKNLPQEQKMKAIITRWKNVPMAK